jgi:hypothetical protein
MKNLRFVVLGDPKRIDPSVFTGRADVSSEFRVPGSKFRNSPSAAMHP